MKTLIGMYAKEQELLCGNNNRFWAECKIFDSFTSRFKIFILRITKLLK